MDRREFLLAAAAAAAAAEPAAPASAAAASLPSADPLEELSLADIAAAFAEGRLTSQQLTQGYLTRIDKLDRHGPNLRSVIETNPRALEIAAALDNERKTHGSRGPLHGVPILIKDNIETSDHMMSTAGSLALEGWYASQDAPLVERLRAAGAVILGKTNLERVGEFSLHSFVERLERPRRPVPQPIRRQSHALRLELRVGSRGLRESLRDCRGHGDRWIDCKSGLGQRHRRFEAYSRPGQPPRHRADLA